MKQALPDRFKDHRSNYDLGDQIWKRLQQPNKGFGGFSKAVPKILERVEHPLSEAKLIETFRRRQLPSTQSAILHFPITVMYQLQQLVLQQENLEARLVNSLQARLGSARRRVEEMDPYFLYRLNQWFQLETVGSRGCWNCGKEG